MVSLNQKYKHRGIDKQKKTAINSLQSGDFESFDLLCNINKLSFHMQKK